MIGLATCVILAIIAQLGCIENGDHYESGTASAMRRLAGQFETLVSLEPEFKDFRPRDFAELHRVLVDREFVTNYPIFERDAWENPYVLLSDTVDREKKRVYVIVSKGPDGVLNTKDDLRFPTRVPYEPATSTSSSLPASSPADTGVKPIPERFGVRAP
ncbi:MAG: hypothetical protein QUV05_08745 [Phycisphaerae bacterium]|nr:hypothetical protein [Phycisphaerae bacterium]